MSDGARGDSGRQQRHGGLRVRRGLAILFALTLSLLAVGSVSAAATTLSVTTPYPAVSVAPGSKASFDLTVTTDQSARVDLAVTGVPEGWKATITGGGYVVTSVLVPEPSASAPPSVRLDVTVPDNAAAQKYSMTVTATSGTLKSDLPIDVTVDAATAGDVTMTTDFPTLNGPSSQTFTFNLTLQNSTAQDLTFGLNAQGPTGWDVTAKPASQANASTFQVKAGDSGGVTVTAVPPANVAEGSYPITVTATAGSRNVGGQLQVDITGDFAMTLTTPDGRLNASGPAGGVIQRSLRIQNTGTAALTNVTMTESLPTDWKVTYDPAGPIVSVAGGATQDITANITPAANAIAGDYQATFTATAGGSSTTANTDIRVTIETPLNWLVVGAGIIVLVLVGLGFVFSRYGRR